MLRGAIVIAAAALGLSGCGSAGSAAASQPQPPSPIVVSVSISSAGVHVSPARFGGGPVLLTAANQSSRSVSVVVRRGGGRTLAAVARSAPINPMGDIQLKVDLQRGDYSLTALARPGGRARATTRQVTALHVGRERTSAGSDTLEP